MVERVAVVVMEVQAETAMLFTTRPMAAMAATGVMVETVEMAVEEEMAATAVMVEMCMSTSRVAMESLPRI